MSPPLTALILAPLVWKAHFLTVYVASALVCERGGSTALIPPMTAVFTAVAGFALMLLTALAQRPAPAGSTSPDRQRFVYQTGLLVIFISALGLVWNTLPGLLTPTCS
jgi:hypothetical protein